MNNSEALAALVAQRDKLDDAITGLHRYEREGSDWKASAAATNMDQVKSDALAGGVDLATWDGTAAP